MSRRRLWQVALVALVALLGGVSPLSVAAQFPSQEGGEAPAPGGFPQGNGGRGGFYQGQIYDFSLTWGPAWNLVNEGADQGFEALTVTNGVSTVIVGGFALQSSPQDSVMQTAEELGGGQWTFNTVAIDEPNVAAAYFDTSEGVLAHFIYIEEIGPGSGLFTIWQFPVAQYESESTAVFQDLLGGLQYSVTS